MLVAAVALLTVAVKLLSNCFEIVLDRSGESEKLEYVVLAMAELKASGLPLPPGILQQGSKGAPPAWAGHISTAKATKEPREIHVTYVDASSTKGGHHTPSASSSSASVASASVASASASGSVASITESGYIIDAAKVYGIAFVIVFMGCIACGMFRCAD